MASIFGLPGEFGDIFFQEKLVRGREAGVSMGERVNGFYFTRMIQITDMLFTRVSPPKRGVPAPEPESVASPIVIVWE